MIRKRDAWIPAAFLAVVLAAASCSSGGGSGRSTPTGPGNGGGSPELNSPNLAAGATYEHRFWAAGAYPYYCIYHTAMTGAVVVDANALDTLVNVSITSSTSQFPAASVRPGGRVVWTNNSQMTHTVTSR